MKNASINCGCYTFDNIRHAGIYFGVEGIPLPQAITHPAHLPKYLGGTSSPPPPPPHYSMHYLSIKKVYQPKICLVIFIHLLMILIHANSSLVVQY